MDFAGMLAAALKWVWELLGELQAWYPMTVTVTVVPFKFVEGPGCWAKEGRDGSFIFVSQCIGCCWNEYSLSQVSLSQVSLCHRGGFSHCHGF
jgi:hypothetical protein